MVHSNKENNRAKRTRQHNNETTSKKELDENEENKTPQRMVPFIFSLRNDR